jgi:hypothetical protein
MASAAGEIVGARSIIPSPITPSPPQPQPQPLGATIGE